MRGDLIDAAYDDKRAFAKFCKNYGIEARRAVCISRQLCDRSAFCRALEALNPAHDQDLSLRFLELIAAQIVIQDPSLFPDMGPSSAVKDVSKKELLKKAQKVGKQSQQLRTNLLELFPLVGFAVEFHDEIDEGERHEARGLVSLARSTVEPLEKLLLAIERLEPLLNRGKKRAVKIGTSMSVFDRLLARLWLDSGKPVTTSGDGPFARFLEHSYGSAGREFNSLSHRLSSANAETRTKASKDIRSQLKKADAIRHTDVFDRHFRGRSRKGTDIDGHAKSVEKK